MIRRFLATSLFCLALPAAAQSVPASNYTDMWYVPAESGWGVSFLQHAGTHQVFAVWYTYDPREADATTPSNSRPLWVVMPGGRWTSPTTITGTAYVTHGEPFQSGRLTASNPVGTFTFNFQNAQNGTFTYNIAPPAGIGSDQPAFGLPAFSGSKAITRQSF
jgi:hypothetical protein